LKYLPKSLDTGSCEAKPSYEAAGALAQASPLTWKEQAELCLLFQQDLEATDLAPKKNKVISLFFSFHFQGSLRAATLDPPYAVGNNLCHHPRALLQGKENIKTCRNKGGTWSGHCIRN